MYLAKDYFLYIKP